jgi:hypothetical protein
MKGNGRNGNKKGNGETMEVSEGREELVMDGRKEA